MATIVEMIRGGMSDAGIAQVTGLPESYIADSRRRTITTNGAAPMASKTEQKIMDALATRGWYCSASRRAFKVAARLRDKNAIPGAHYSFNCWNAGTHGRYVPAQDVYISIPHKA